jgi:hypothetical protein
MPSINVCHLTYHRWIVLLHLDTQAQFIFQYLFKKATQWPFNISHLLLNIFSYIGYVLQVANLYRGLRARVVGLYKVEVGLRHYI